MDITEVRIKLMEEPGERLKAFCSITFDDCFVVRDLKIIEGTSGPFVAMPSRKLTSHCPKCGMKNHLRANFCNQCGARQSDSQLTKDSDGRAKLYADIAHPINSACREMIQDHVVREFYDEVDRSKSPGYVSRYEDFDAGDFSDTPAESSSTSGEIPRRFDRPHDRASANRPHHPPQGDPAHSRGGPGPHGPGSSEHARDQRASEGGGGGFGAGIF